MDTLPHHLLDESLFRIDHRSLAMIQCTNRSLQSHISKNPNFASEYFSRIRSSLLYIATHGCPLICYHLYGYCSGLLLLFLNKNLCVVNPLTKKFQFLNHSRSKFFPTGFTLRRGRQQVIGFAVDQTDRTTPSFKIVNIKEGALHWLRNDGSIVAFNLKTEKARLIPIRFPKELCLKTLFTAVDNNLTLISATEEVIYVYAFHNILSDPKWVLVKQIRNGVLDEKRLYSWYVEAYDGKSLVLRETILKKDYYNKHLKQVLYGYDVRANKWEVIGSIPEWSPSGLDFYQFTPSPSLVIGLDDKEREEILACDDKRIPSLNAIMRLIHGIS
ncbi:putative F-box protein [Arabidopsis thaliana]